MHSSHPTPMLNILQHPSSLSSLADRGIFGEDWELAALASSSADGRIVMADGCINTALFVCECSLDEHARDVIVRVVGVGDDVDIRIDLRNFGAVDRRNDALLVATLLGAFAESGEFGGVAVLRTLDFEAIVVGVLATEEGPLCDGPLIVLGFNERDSQRGAEDGGSGHGGSEELHLDVVV
jgi:hypothetical protein